jgi:hypothetical protein
MVITEMRKREREERNVTEHIKIFLKLVMKCGISLMTN